MNAIAVDAFTVESLIHRELPAAASGDRLAYGRIVAASQNTIASVALAITRDVPASEDIAQEAFLSGWQNLRKLQNPASFLPWLRQIARNLAHDHLRGHARRPRNVDHADAAIEAVADPHPTPVDRLIEQEQQAVAAELISALPDDSREVLLLYYREGQSSRQVARLLGLSDAAVRKRLSRARSSVREDLLQRFGEFARNSSPGAAFSAAVSTVLGATGKPAAATPLLLSVVSGATAPAIAKGLTGSIAAFAPAILAATAVTWWCGRRLLSYADGPDERRAIRGWLVAYLAWGAAHVAGGLAVFRLSSGWQAFVAFHVSGLLVLNYLQLGRLPRLMNPLISRDAARHPERAWRRALEYRLTWGSTAVITNNIVLVATLGFVLLVSGRLG